MPIVERIVVKLGTGYLYKKSPDGNRYVPRRGQLNGLVQDLYEIKKIGVGLIVVSSGAIATGGYKENLEVPEGDIERARIAGIGQHQLMYEYGKRFKKCGITVAQCLVTREEVDITLNDPEMIKRRVHLQNVQDGYFKSGVLAIYNENDVVATDEISFGDNDPLAAMVAVTMKANLLVMLSYPVEGFGRGGEESKEIARRICEENGIRMVIINELYKRDKSGLYKPLIANLLRIGE